MLKIVEKAVKRIRNTHIYNYIEKSCSVRSVVHGEHMAEEKSIEEKLCKEVKKIGGLALKFLSTVNGYPDRIILVKIGRVAFVEVKAPGKKPRPIQVKRIKQLRELGFKVYVLDNKKDIPNIIDEIKGGESQ